MLVGFFRGTSVRHRGYTGSRSHLERLLSEWQRTERPETSRRREPTTEEGGGVVRLEAVHHEQANEVVAARAFGAMLGRARDAVANLTRKVEPGPGEKLATLVSDSALRNSIRDLRSAATSYVGKADAANVKEPMSRWFADAVFAADDSESIRLLV